MSDTKWLSAYLFYAEPFEPLLVDFVWPFANQVLANPGIEQFFYIRYWHKGPHIRIRFKVSDDETYHGLKRSLDEKFEAYVNKNPSNREEPDWVSNLDEENRWWPNNSMQYVSYEPEIERYGGTEAILIAEQHFQNSSNTILEILSKTDGWDYERALGTAIQLHLSFAFALKMSTKEARLFFDYIFVSWFPRAIARNWSNLDVSEQAEMKKETLNAFEKGFENQKEVLVPFCQNFWDMLQNGKQIPENLNIWVDKTKESRERLIDSQKCGSLITPSWFKTNKKWDIPPENQERWRIYQSYVHMTNNRLGILNRDEGFLGFLIRESFKNMSKK